MREQFQEWPERTKGKTSCNSDGLGKAIIVADRHSGAFVLNDHTTRDASTAVQCHQSSEFQLCGISAKLLGPFIEHLEKAAA